MDAAIQTLFYPFENGALSRPAAGQATLFLNADWHETLSQFNSGLLTLQQYFKPAAHTLHEHGFQVISTPQHSHPPYDLVLLHAPKNRAETQYLMACAAARLSNGGKLVCAAANDAGGSRLEKFMKELGFINIQSLSKNKSRVVWGEKPADHDADVQRQWLEAGALQEIMHGQFLSQPGMFGWDKIDAGSALLTAHLPETLPGAGADFGCGYGYLSAHILADCSGIESLVCIDADYRAIEAAQKNLARFNVVHRYLWEDLTAPLPGLMDLDWIVMNPPFHAGKIADSDIGVAFIKNAAASLRFGGTLYMVANAQLPYEQTLGSLFKTVEKKFEGQGFKIYAATK